MLPVESLILVRGLLLLWGEELKLIEGISLGLFRGDCSFGFEVVVARLRDLFNLTLLSHDCSLFVRA